MTAQSCEILLIDRRKHMLRTRPLDPHLESLPEAPECLEGRFSTNLHRGYIGTWAIKRGALILAKLARPDWPNGERILPAEQFFPGRDYPVPATWFSGQLRLPVGTLVIQSHMGWSSQYEKNRLITIRDGAVIRDRTYNNIPRLKRKVAASPFLSGYLHASVQGEEERDSFVAKNHPVGPLYWFTREGMGLLI